MATGSNPEIPNPDERLVKVFDSEQESEVMVVRSLLESAGIDTATTNLDAPQDILPGVGGIILQVRAGQADEARQIIEEYRAAGEAAAEEAEQQTEAGPPEDKQG
jgi:arginyl-tRNA synthetase